MSDSSLWFGEDGFNMLLLYRLGKSSFINLSVFGFSLLVAVEISVIVSTAEVSTSGFFFLVLEVAMKICNEQFAFLVFQSIVL